MCGLAGFLSPSFTENQLHTMTECLQHRGPDAEGFHFDQQQGIGLGHRRLSILDLSNAGNQPFYSRDGRFIMVYNGEVYNFRELAVQFNITPRTHSDSEIILEAFAKKGIDCVQDFNGMFAMAIWDRIDKELYLIRDRFGVKPLLYYHKENEFAFASELKALLKLPIEKKLNTEALKDYLFLEYVPDATCIIQNCNKLPAGHYLILTQNKLLIKQYYSLLDKIKPRPLTDLGEERVLDEFQELLGSSVKYRQISDVPIGAFLSGGTDSSLICALFQQQNEKPINTFTIGFDVAKFDESLYASRVAHILHTNHTQFRLNGKDSFSIVDNLVEYYDEPFAAPSCIPSYLVCHEARKMVKVAMSGDGGDELFMGYGYYDLYTRVKKLFRIDPGYGRRFMNKIFNLMGPRYQRASRIFNLSENDLFVHLWSEQEYMFSEKEISELIGEEYVNRTVRDEWRKIDALSLHDFEKISLFDINQYLVDNLLYKMDSASMANSLEVRNPYLDYRLVEYSYNLPLYYKIRHGEQKYLLKKLLERYLPKDLVYRKKWGFPAPIADWLSGELAYLIDKWLNPQILEAQGIFNSKLVRKYVDAFRNGKDFHYKRLWSIIVFQMWFYKYLEGNVG